MATISISKLNILLREWPSGAPRTSADLATAGISADLAVHYGRSGWLVRLARGVYARPGDRLDRHACLRMLQQDIQGLHVGGKTALDWQGLQQYLVARPRLVLYGWNAARLPAWFTERFPAEYHRKRLFDEPADAPLHTQPLERRDDAAMVSARERALLEMLSEVGVRQSLSEARELTESAYSLRADVLQQLLERCSSVKTVRLCLQLGRELDLPWIGNLDVARLPTGSPRRWVSRSADGLLVLKP